MRKAAGLLQMPLPPPAPVAVNVICGSRWEEDLPESTTDRARLFLSLLSLQLVTSSLLWANAVQNVAPSLPRRGGQTLGATNSPSSPATQKWVSLQAQLAQIKRRRKSIFRKPLPAFLCCSMQCVCGYLFALHFSGSFRPVLFKLCYTYHRWYFGTWQVRCVPQVGKQKKV